MSLRQKIDLSYQNVFIPNSVKKIGGKYTLIVSDKHAKKTRIEKIIINN